MKVSVVVLSNSEIVSGTKNPIFEEIRSALHKNNQKVVSSTMIEGQSFLLNGAIEFAFKTSDVVVLLCENSVDKMYLAKNVLCDKFCCSLTNSLFAKKHVDEVCCKLNIPLKKEDNAFFQMPSIARTIKNPLGLFQGCLMEQNGKTLFLLPAEHEQLRHMFFASVLPYILQSSGSLGKTYVFKTFGIRHQEMMLLLKDFFSNKQNIEIVCNEYLLAGEVVVKVPKVARVDFAENFVKAVYAKLLPYVYSDKDESMEEFVRALVEMQNKTLAFAEDFTGGAMASAFFEKLDDANKFLKASFVTKDKKSKTEILGIDQKLLEKSNVDFGEVAYQMAVGALRVSGADVAVSSFGNIQNGECKFAIGSAEGIHVFETKVSGSLEQKIGMATNTIFFKLIKKIKQNDFHLGETVI